MDGEEKALEETESLSTETPGTERELAVESGTRTPQFVSNCSSGRTQQDRYITLACHNLERVVLFKGTESSPYNELKRLYFQTYSVVERQLELEPTSEIFVEEEMPAFELLDKDFDVFFEDFSSSDVKDGSFIQVREWLLKTADEIQEVLLQKKIEQMGAGPPPAAQADPADNPASWPLPPGVTQSMSGLSASIIRTMSSPMLKLSRSLTTQMSRTATRVASGVRALPELPSSYLGPARLRGTVWQALDDPVSSDAAACLTLFIGATIVLSTARLLTWSIPPFYNRADGIGGWFIVETAFAAVFSLELLARMWSSPSRREFWTDPFNIIDIVAVVPYYAELPLVLNSKHVPEVIPMLGLLRLFRLLKLSRGSVKIFTQTMLSSMRLLYMLLFVVLLGTLVFSTLMYYVERGEWNPILGAYVRRERFLCPVDSEPEESCAPGSCVFSGSGDAKSHMRVYSWRRSDRCVRESARGPYISIWDTMWFVMQTITTVGFGNDTPIGHGGKALAAGIIVFGLLAVSLPVTVIGANFSRTYARHQRAAAAREMQSRFSNMSWLQRFTHRLIYS
uniref:Voltage-gated ion channel superfamily n=1 Tax=Tetraselmis sp. GSL018 TaxID=582737 RepID=A0A061R7M7_9CHLO|mmetsp:Transcript_836/g.2012  ORF Transcript_836/g.2012 Transcript_836/m.2012 type:complete len:566 (-) Transcript_836:180-1877(-)